MLRALAFLGRHAGALLVVALVRLEGRQILALLMRPAASVAVVIWVLLVVPVLMTGAVALVDPAPKLGTAMVLSAACPPIMTAIAFCFMVGLDAALATVVVFAAIFLVPL